MVIGQPDFTSNSINQGLGVDSPMANTLYNPHSLYTDGTRLFIGDSRNLRVLIFNTIPTTNNASADIVIGQPNMITNQEWPIDSKTFKGPLGPYGVTSDGTHLFISENNRGRVLVFNTIPASDYPSADVVIGQVDFTVGEHNRGEISPAANTLYSPYGLYSDGNKLFICDHYNHRVLGYNTIPTSNNASADIVLGQPDFTSGVENQGGSVGANTFYRPTAISIYGSKVCINDRANNRVLIYYVSDYTPPQITRAYPKDKAGVAPDTTRVTNDTSFYICLKDIDGIDITQNINESGLDTSQNDNIKFTISYLDEDNTKVEYTRSLGDTSTKSKTVSSGKINDTESNSSVTGVWVTYNITKEVDYNNRYPFDTVVRILSLLGTLFAI